MARLPPELTALIISYMTDLYSVDRLLSFPTTRKLLRHVRRIQSYHGETEYGADPVDILPLRGVEVVLLPIFPTTLADMVDLARLPNLRECHLELGELRDSFEVASNLFWHEFLAGLRFNCKEGEMMIITDSQRSIKGINIKLHSADGTVTVKRRIVRVLGRDELYDQFAATRNLYGVGIGVNHGQHLIELLERASEFYKVALPPTNRVMPDGNYLPADFQEMVEFLTRFPVRVIIDLDDSSLMTVAIANRKLLHQMTVVQHLQKMKAVVPLRAAEEVLAKFPNLIELALVSEHLTVDIYQLIIRLLVVYPRLKLILYLPKEGELIKHLPMDRIKLK